MPKKCFYEILGVSPHANDKTIKKAYRQGALRWHPDKNQGDAEATDRFKEVQEAYDILMDGNERAWYDDNREKVLASDDEVDESFYEPEAEAELDYDKWCSTDQFSGFNDDEGAFYGVYSRVFDELDRQEKTARDGDLYRAGFGTADSTEDVVAAFYTYWCRFSSHRTFASKDKWDVSQAPNRSVARLMLQKNKNERANAKKEFNLLVRRLASWVQSLDPRWAVIAAKPKAQGAAGEGVDVDAVDINMDGMDEDERLAAQEKERRRLYGEEEEEEVQEVQIFHCAPCTKRFKSAKQLANHEKSGKHKTAVIKLRQQLQQSDAFKDLAGSVEAFSITEDQDAATEVETEKRGKGKKKKKKKAEEPADAASAADAAPDDAGADAGGGAPTEELEPLQTRDEYENSEEYRSLNKTQRRKAMQQWEAENAYMEKARGGSKAKKAPKASAKPEKVQKAHVTGGHNREFRMPKKKKEKPMGRKKGGKSAANDSD